MNLLDIEMSSLKHASTQLSTTQICGDCFEEHSDELHVCQSSYSAQHPMLAFRLSVKNIGKKDHLDDYREVNPFEREIE